MGAALTLAQRDNLKQILDLDLKPLMAQGTIDAIKALIDSAQAGEDESGSVAGSHFYYVDGSRTDTYVANGTQDKPYKTILEVITLIQVLANAQIALGTQAAYDTTRYIISVAPGVYSDNLLIGNMKYLGIHLNGATISGTITNTTTMIGGAVTDYYSKLEFIGAPSSRAYRGRCGVLTGDITLNRNNDSLHYVNFTGVEVAGNLQAGTPTVASEGSFVVGLQNAYFSQSSKYISAYLTSATSHIMLESWGYNVIKCKLAKQDNSATKLTLYNCNNTSFEADITTTPVENCIIKNCQFSPSKTVSIVAVKTLSIDANSYKQLMAATETLTGMTISHLDNTGADITPVTRTTGQLVATNTINENIDILDAGIGFDAQLSGTPKLISKDQTIYQNLDALDTYKSVETIKKTVSWSGGTGTFKLPASADMAVTNIDLGSIVPAYARVLDVFVKTRTAAVFTGGPTTLVAGVGNVTGGTQFIASDSIYTNMLQPAVGAGFTLVGIDTAASKVWLTDITPGINWDQQTAGDWDVYVTYIKVDNI